MQRKHIGNELDCMKGAVLGALQEKELLQGLVVDPMAEDASFWTAEDLNQYVRCLRLGRAHRIAQHDVQWGTRKRDAYFAELDRYSGRDFFLDPVAGVATGSKVNPNHVRSVEALDLLQDQNVVAVYQHGENGKTIEQRVQTVVQELQRCQPSIECLAYMDVVPVPRRPPQPASLLFLTTARRRLLDIETCLDGAHLSGSLKWFAPNRCLLTAVKLKNYKSIAIADVRLPQVSLLVGPNGAGKSNFMDALRFVADALNTSLDQALRVRGGVGLVQRQPIADGVPFGVRMQLELEACSGWYALEIRGRAEDGYEVCREECRLTGRRAAREHFYRVERGQVTDASISNAPAAAEDRLYLVTASGFKEFRPAFDALAGMRFANPIPERMRPIQAPGNASSLNRDCSNAASVLGGLEKRFPPAKRRIDEYLGCIVPGIVETRRSPKDTAETLQFLLQVDDGKVRLPASSMSDGTLRALGALLALFQGATQEDAGRRLVGIEEPEAGQHPGAVEVLADAIREAAMRAQVIVTSHSPELLDSIADESIITVEAHQDGTRFGTLDDAARSVIRDRLFTAGELLRIDQLGMEEREERPEEAFDLFAQEA